MPATTTGEQNSLATRVKVVAALLVLMWGIEIADTILPFLDLQSHGIRPRSLDGLQGLVFAPFLHGGWDHIIANSVPFVVLGLLVVSRGVRWFVAVTAIIAVVGGAGVWIFARSANHIGASGLIFGYIGFLICAGVFERSLKAVVIALAVGFLYGGVLWSGALPSIDDLVNGTRISWEGHLFGAVSGGFAAWVLTRKRARARARP